MLNAWSIGLAFAILLPLLAGAQPQLDFVASLHGNGYDSAAAMTLDADGNIYLTGSTDSFDLATPGAFQSRRASSSLYSFNAALGKLTPVYLLHSEEIVSLATDTHNPGTVYAATQSRLIRTADNGLTWTTLSSGVPADRQPLAVGVAPSDTLYAVFGPRPEAPGFKSSDAGATWTPNVLGSINR